MTHVLIVGAGPTGLTLAVELARRGVDLRIVDKFPQPSLRALDTSDCKAAIGCVGGSSGHRSSISRSAVTTRPGSSASRTSRARTRAPPTAPPATCRGPKIATRIHPPRPRPARHPNCTEQWVRGSGRSCRRNNSRSSCSGWSWRSTTPSSSIVTPGPRAVRGRPYGRGSESERGYSADNRSNSARAA
ncbi:FAD-dependent monooxygenase [Nonomuraea sp. NPDC046802]|uniref:FAD-dependent monooxygenase n=1 Tax=Nonomuraea sp. NPDC046802 TaxID=3154919 RepID=UPI0033E3B583